MIDWDAIKLEYITTNTSYRRLGEKYDMSHKKISERGKREDWVGKKKRWKEKAMAKAMEKATKAEIDRLSGLRTAADNLSALMEQVTSETDAFYGDGKPNARAMQQTVAALKDLTATIRNLYDMPTRGERETQELARERLALERERLALEKTRISGGREDETAGVVEIGAVITGDDG